jgi:hypothetical protein
MYVKYLIFGKNFDQPINDWLPSVMHLQLGRFFNQSIKNSENLSNVTDLTLNCNLMLRCPVPGTITRLTFGEHFNYTINKHMLGNITHLTFGDNFNQKIKDCIPQSVTHLTFGELFNQSIKTDINSAGNIRIGIPSSVTHLTFGNRFDQSIKAYRSTDRKIVIPAIPLSVTNLIFGDKFNQPIKNKIPSVTHLTLGWHFNYPIEGVSMTHLMIAENYAGHIDKNIKCKIIRIKY